MVRGVREQIAAPMACLKLLWFFEDGITAPESRVVYQVTGHRSRVATCEGGLVFVLSKREFQGATRGFVLVLLRFDALFIPFQSGFNCTHGCTVTAFRELP